MRKIFALLLFSCFVWALPPDGYRVLGTGRISIPFVAYASYEIPVHDAFMLYYSPYGSEWDRTFRFLDFAPAKTFFQAKFRLGDTTRLLGYFEYNPIVFTGDGYQVYAGASFKPFKDVGVYYDEPILESVNDSVVMFSDSLYMVLFFDGGVTHWIPIRLNLFGGVYNAFCWQCFAGEIEGEGYIGEYNSHYWYSSIYSTGGHVAASRSLNQITIQGKFYITKPGGQCTDSQIAGNADAMITGTNGRYQAWDLGCDNRTVIRPSSTSHVPSCDGINCKNAAGMIDGRGNWLADGWDLEAGRQAIWVDPEEMKDICEATSLDGYFVYCTPSAGGGQEPPGWVWDDPNGNPPPGPPPSGGGGLPSSSSNGVGPGLSSASGWQPVYPNPPGGVVPGGSSSSPIAELTKWEDMLKRVIPPMPTIPDPRPLLREILNWFKGQFEPKPDPEMPELEDLDEPPDLPELDSIPDLIDSSIFKFDTTLFDKIKKEILDSLPPLDTSAFTMDKLLDSLPKPPDKDSLAKKVANEMKEQFDDVKKQVEQAFKPLENLFTGSGSCNCLADSFNGLSFSTGFASFAVSGFPTLTQKICDSVGVIRFIVLLICAVGNIGLIFWVLRR